MATRGPKPKSAEVHILQGTYRPGRHEEAAENAPQPEGQLEKPKWLKQRQGGQVWDELAPQLTWLKRIDSEKLAAFCKLSVAIHEEDALDVPASYWSQWRTLGAELGFDPAGRVRIGASGKPKQTDPTAKFFG